MRRTVLVLVVLILATSALPAQRMTEDEEKVRVNRLFEFAKTEDPPSRHTAYYEMTRFGGWIEPLLMEKIETCTIQERLLFLMVLRAREVVRVREFSQRELVPSVERCEKALIAAARIAELNALKRKAEKDGGDGSQYDSEIATLRRDIIWREVPDGAEVALHCDILSTFGREDALKLMVDMAVRSATDDTLVKGFTVRMTHSRKGKIMPGGTEAWNICYNPVWEALEILSHRSLDAKVIAAQRKKLADFFEKLSKKDAENLNPNQTAALKRYQEIEDALFKTEAMTAEDEKPSDKDTPDDEGIIRK